MGTEKSFLRVLQKMWISFKKESELFRGPRRTDFRVPQKMAFWKIIVFMNCETEKAELRVLQKTTFSKHIFILGGGPRKSVLRVPQKNGIWKKGHFFRRGTKKCRLQSASKKSIDFANDIFKRIWDIFQSQIFPPYWIATNSFFPKLRLRKGVLTCLVPQTSLAKGVLICFV